jgi:hypothetical protein
VEVAKTPQELGRQLSQLSARNEAPQDFNEMVEQIVTTSNTKKEKSHYPQNRMGGNSAPKNLKNEEVLTPLKKKEGLTISVNL